MDNLNDIISSLSPDDINMLKGVASSILGENGGDSPDRVQAVPQGDKGQGNAAHNAVRNPQSNPGDLSSVFGSLGLNSEDFNMMMKAKAIFDRMNNASSKNADLILALKPHLSQSSRQKADQAIKILKLFEILPYLKDLF